MAVCAVYGALTIPTYFPHPRSLSRRERDAKPFSPREKGGDEGKVSRSYVILNNWHVPFSLEAPVITKHFSPGEAMPTLIGNSSS